MSPKLRFALLFFLVALFAWILPVSAGGAVASLDNMPSDVQAGQPFTVGFMLFSAHDGSPLVGFEPSVVATNPRTGEKVEIAATPAGEAGHYTATVTLPSAGEWAWNIQLNDYPLPELTPLQVAEAPEGVTASTTPVTSALPYDTLAVGLALLAVLTLGVMLFYVRSQRAAVARV